MMNASSSFGLVGKTAREEEVNALPERLHRDRGVVLALSYAAAEGVRHSAGKPAAELFALKQAPERLARDTDSLGRAPMAAPPGVRSQESANRVDPLVVAH